MGDLTISSLNCYQILREQWKICAVYCTTFILYRRLITVPVLNCPSMNSLQYQQLNKWRQRKAKERCSGVKSVRRFRVSFRRTDALRNKCLRKYREMFNVRYIYAHTRTHSRTHARTYMRGLRKSQVRCK